MIKNIFETKIYEVDMPNYDKQGTIDKLMPFFDESSLHLNSEGEGKSNYWQINGKLHDHVDISDITTFIMEHARIYWKTLGYGRIEKLKISHSWANITPHNGWIRNHNHLPCPIVGSFYVNATPEMGNLIIEHPLSTMLAFQPWENMSLTESYTNTIEIEAYSGKLVLFPGYLNHWVHKNETHEDRIGIAFNIMPIFGV
jgi:uncharacterized protein (TIGR02466 family)